MMNVDTEIYIALRDHLNTFPNAPFITYPGDTYTPPTDANGLPAMYWIVQDLRYPVTTQLIGADDTDIYSGAFQVHIMAPNEMTHVQIMYQIDLLRAHFPKLSELWVTGGKVQVIDTPYLAIEPYRDGVYYRAPVLIPWRLVA